MSGLPGGFGAPGNAGGFGAPAPQGTGRGPVRWCRLVMGIVLLVIVGIPAMLGGVAVLIGGTVAGRQHPVSEGRAPGELSFKTQAGQRYVVALSASVDSLFGAFTDDMTNDERRVKYRVRESDANEARCTITQPDGSTDQIRGDRQTVNTVFGTVYATVGRFDGQAGTTRLACRFDPERDMIGTRTESPLMVHEASSMTGLGFGILGVGLVVFLLGLLQILRATALRKPR